MKIKDSKDFVPVKKDGKTYYGGHQEWLKYEGLSKFFRDRSCVVTAFTNVYFYMFKKGPVDFKTYNKAQYFFYKRIRPKANGVPTVSSLIKRLGVINHKMGLGLSAFSLEENFFIKKPIEEKIAFINEGLKADSPVILINWMSRNVSLASHHGFVITELNKKNGKHEVVASSWGRVHRFYLEDFDSQLRTYTGYMYLRRKDGK